MSIAFIGAAALFVFTAIAEAAPPSDEPISTAGASACATGAVGASDPGPSLLRVILQCRKELAVSETQMERLDRVVLDLARAQIRRRADLEVVSLELAVLFDPDASDPARPEDAAVAEAKIRDLARITADGEVARVQAIESIKAALTAEQRIRLFALVNEAPSDPRAPGGGGHARPQAPHGSSPARPPAGHFDHHAHPPIHSHPWIGVRPWVTIDPFWPAPWPAPLYVYPPPPAYAQPPAYWYYCPSAGAYYPDVQTCPEGWVTVAPRASGQ